MLQRLAPFKRRFMEHRAAARASKVIGFQAKAAAATMPLSESMCILCILEHESLFAPSIVSAGMLTGTVLRPSGLALAVSLLQMRKAAYKRDYMENMPLQLVNSKRYTLRRIGTPLIHFAHPAAVSCILLAVSLCMRLMRTAAFNAEY
jgi:hypothetical protein